MKISDSRLISLKDWNGKAMAEHVRQAERTRKVSNGIACPECGKELLDSDRSFVLTSSPAQYKTECECGYRGYLFI